MDPKSFIINTGNRAQVQRLFDAVKELFKAGEPMQVDITEPKRTRSLDQNNRYWALLGALAKYTGHHKDELHEICLQKFHGYDVIPFGEHYIIRARGRSKDQAVTDFSDLIETAEELCREHIHGWVGLGGKQTTP